MNEDALKLENQLCFRAYTASRLTVRLYKPILDELKLTYPQYVTMLVLWDENSISFTELSKLLHMKTGTLTPVIQRLEKLGYVKKMKDPDDDRKAIIALTDAGGQLKTTACKIPELLAESLNLNTDEYLSYIKTLDELLDKLFVANHIENEK